jgi:flagellar basal body-associated protein FliL
MSQPPGYPPPPGDPQDPRHQQPPPGPVAPPTSGVPQPTSGVPGYPPPPGQPGYPPPPDYAAQANYPTGFPAGYPTPEPPRRHRGLLITSIVLGVVLLLCGGGGTTAYFLIKNIGNQGKASPSAAVDGFLTAVFRDHDVEKANKFVCSDSRDKAALSRKIDELRSYEQKYKSPQYSWTTPTVQSRKGSTATLTVPLKITTADDRVAEMKLKFVTVDDSGWWVCEVGSAS